MDTQSTPDHTLRLVDATCAMLDGDLTAASGEATPTLSAWRGIVLAEGMTELHQKLGMLKNALEAGNGQHIKDCLTDLGRMTRDASGNADGQLKEHLAKLAACLHDGASSINQDQSDMINSAYGPSTPSAKFNQGEDGVQRNATQGPTAEANADRANGGPEQQGQDTNRSGHPSQADGPNTNRGSESQGKDANESGHPSQAEGDDSDAADQGMGGSQLGTTSGSEERATTSNSMAAADIAARGSYELNMDPNMKDKA